MLSKSSAILEFQLCHVHDESKLLESKTNYIVLEKNSYKTQNIQSENRSKTQKKTGEQQAL